MKSYRKLSGIYAGIIILLAVVAAAAQTTAFNFQGRLNDGTSPANGKYDLEFRLYDALTGGNQVGSTVSKANLTLVNGVFSTPLDFNAAAFDGGDRFIEIGLRRTTTSNTVPNAFVILGPRQQILSVPYSIRSLRATLADDATHAVNADNATIAANSLSLSGVPATSYLQKDGDGSQLTNVSAVTAQTAINSQQLGGVAATQFVQKGTSGTVAAMLFYDSNSLTGNNIVKCYNSTLLGTAATTPPCGFAVNHFTPGGFGINFGFNIRSSVISLATSSIYNGSDYVNTGIYWQYSSNSGNSSLDIRTYKSRDSTTTTDPFRGFSVIIYY